MTKNFYAFPSIEAFKNVIRNVKDHVRYAGRDENGDPIFNNNRLPTISFRGTNKLHGTNSAVVVNGNNVTFQSRSRIITPEDDNAGFAAFMQDKTQWFKENTDSFDLVDGGMTTAFYGEWCGGNIQKGVAINGLPKMFVIFAIARVGYNQDERSWIPVSWLYKENIPENVYLITDFPTYTIDIDFERPEEAQNKLIELTLKVEEECPVGVTFGRTKENGAQNTTGEGIVWTPTDLGYNSSKFWMKVKGQLHSTSKVKTMAAVDVEAVENQRVFIDSVVTENRLQQGLSVLKEVGKPLEMSSMGDYLRWIFNDIVKEDSDVAEASGLDIKKMGGAIANKARPWYVNAIQTKD